ncbi:MAG: fumarylacetoacetate hydrolase family protein, partial [Serratia proteamaculans]
KSADGFSVLGPWIVTPDEIGDPNALDLSIRVNGQLRQHSNTRHLIYNVQRLIAYASAMFTLWPGDVIYTGTPSGVSPIQAGDRIEVSIERIGAMSVTIADSTP